MEAPSCDCEARRRKGSTTAAYVLGSGMSHVYFIKPVGMEGPIKIGRSISPTGRLGSLATWSPFPLELVASIEDTWDSDLERRFHAFFLAQHVGREWFRASADLLETIAAINAGTFDIATLPKGRHLPPWKRVSYASTLSPVVSKARAA